MPGMRERKLHMMGETKSSRGDYGTKGYVGGGKVKPMMGYSKGGITTPVGTTGDDNDVTSSPIGPIGNRFNRLTGKNKSRPSKRGVKRRRP
jgi:hypothetical protein